MQVLQSGDKVYLKKQTKKALNQETPIIFKDSHYIGSNRDQYDLFITSHLICRLNDVQCKWR